MEGLGGWRRRGRASIRCAAVGGALCVAFSLGCSPTQSPRLPEAPREVPTLDDVEIGDGARFSVLSPSAPFLGSSIPEVGRSGLFPVREGEQCRIAVLSNGEESFAKRMQTLERARRSIRIQALIFTADESGLHVAEVLKRKKREGLDVRVIVDAFSNPSLQTQNMYFDLKQHGVEVEGYEAFLLQWLNELPMPQLVPYAEADWINKRFHEKMWLVDAETPERVAVVGGLNIANEYFRVDPENVPRYWRDQDVAVRGDVVRDMAAAFDRNFEDFVEIKESRGIANTNDAWETTRAVLEEVGKLRFLFQTDPDLEERVAAMAKVPAAPQYEEARCRFLQNRPRFHESYIEQAYLRLIDDARHEILIANAYFVPSDELLAALKKAADRCVRVLLLTNSTETNDLPELTMVGRKYYGDLLAVNDSAAVRACPGSSAGVQIWEWTGRAHGDVEAREGTMHAKHAIFDRRVALVGSHNLDPRSENLNSETAIVFENVRLAHALAEMFHQNDLKLSRPIGPEEAAEFEDPSDAIYRLRRDFGSLFEAHL